LKEGASVFIQTSDQAALFEITAEDKGGACCDSQTGNGNCRQCVAVVGSDTDLRLGKYRPTLRRFVTPLLLIPDAASVVLQNLKSATEDGDRIRV
jgi:hypothetical protein